MAGSKLTSDLVDKLLDKLGSDDAFRSNFQKDPKSALQTLGAPADVECGACMQPRQLATKQQFQASRAQFRNALLGKTEQHVFGLEAR
jgi:putative modified peptide